MRYRLRSSSTRSCACFAALEPLKLQAMMIHGPCSSRERVLFGRIGLDTAGQEVGPWHVGPRNRGRLDAQQPAPEPQSGMPIFRSSPTPCKRNRGIDEENLHQCSRSNTSLPTRWRARVSPAVSPRANALVVAHRSGNDPHPAGYPWVRMVKEVGQRKIRRSVANRSSADQSEIGTSIFHRLDRRRHRSSAIGDQGRPCRRREFGRASTRHAPSSWSERPPALACPPHGPSDSLFPRDRRKSPGAW